MSHLPARTPAMQRTIDEALDGMLCNVLARGAAEGHSAARQVRERIERVLALQISGYRRVAY